MSHIVLGHLDVFPMVEVYRVGGGVERRGDERCRAGASNDGSVVAQSSWTGDLQSHMGRV